MVGLAAVTTSISSYISLDHRDMLHITASYLGVFIGGVTLTGSLAAFRKLANMWPKDKMNLPAAALINKPLVAANLVGFAAMSKFPDIGGLMLT